MTIRTITIAEAADVLEVHRSTAYEWADVGKLPVVASGLVPGVQWVVRVEDLAAELEKQWGGSVSDWRQYIRTVVATRQEKRAQERLRRRGIEPGDGEWELGYGGRLEAREGGLEGHNR